MKRYFLLVWILAAGTLFLSGCQQNDLQGLPGKEDLSYSTRVKILVSLSVGDMEVGTSPMSAKSRASDRVVASDLWYAVFDSSSGEIVPAEDGRMMRHFALENGAVPDLEELLPIGDYTLSFLSMSEGGDLSAVQNIGKLTDSWLKASAEGNIDGDFYFGQAPLQVQPEQVNAVNVELKHAAGLFSLKLALANAGQESAIRAVDLSISDGAVCGELSAGGSYENPTPVSGVELTDSREVYLLLPSTEAGPKCTGSVTLTLAGSDGKEYQRSYPFDLMLRAGQRTTFDLRLDLAYDALDVLTQGSVTQEIRMFSDAEPIISVMQNEERRSFYAKEPLKVVKKDNQNAYIQFYSLEGIGRTEIYARVKSGGEYFKVYELDTIRPLAELTLPLRLLQGKVITSVREDGRLVKVPTAGLAWEHFEFRCVNTTSDYWKRFGNGKAKVNFRFRIFGPAQLPPNTDDPTYVEKNFLDVTPSVARKMLVLALNWGYMFSTDEFKSFLDAGGPYHMDTDGGSYINSSPEDMYRRVMELDMCTMMLQKPGVGVEGQALLKVKMIAIPEEQYTAQIPTDNLGAGSLFVKHHEFAHILGFQDNYKAPSGSRNTITPLWATGWPLACNQTLAKLAEAGDLPVKTIHILDKIFN